MSEAFRQVNEIFDSIESGVESSDDPDTLARDARLYSEIANRRCLATFDGDDRIVGLRGCYVGELVFRHPQYGGTAIRTSDYALSTGYTGLTDVEIQDGNIRTGPVRTLELRTHGQSSSNAPEPGEPTRLTAILSVPGGLIGETERCAVDIDPFEFPATRLDLNECAAIFGDAATVMQRLSTR